MSGAGGARTRRRLVVALEQGADVLEMDLQLTADGEVVVLHDGRSIAPPTAAAPSASSRWRRSASWTPGCRSSRPTAPVRSPVSSFDAAYLTPVREQLPEFRTNMPEGETTGFYVRQLVGLHPWWTPPGDVFQVPEDHDGRRVVTSRFVRAAERLGVRGHHLPR